MKTNVRSILCLIMAAIMMIAVAGCSTGTSTDGATATAAPNLPIMTASPASTAAPAPTKDTLIMGMTYECSKLDPGGDSTSNAMGVIANIYDSLVCPKADDASVVEPAIASSWKFSEDGQTLTFELRDDVTFHDGTKMTADDVVYSLNFALAQPLNSPAAGMIDDVTKVDDSHVSIHLIYAYKPILMMLYGPSFGIISQAFHEKCMEDGVNFSSVENGTGAYILKEWVSGNKMVLEANDNWYNGEVPIKNLVYQVVPDATTGALMIEQGEIDALLGMSTADREHLVKAEGITVVDVLSAGTHFIAMNNTKAPFDDPKVREAVSYAVNREEALQGGLNGIGIINPFIITPGFFGYYDGFEPNPYDPEKAKALLAEAGYPDGLDVTWKAASDSWYATPAQVVAEQLRQVGFNVDLQLMERAPYLAEVQSDKMDYQLTNYLTWGTYPDADASMYNKFHTSMWGKPQQNYGFAGNAETDALLDKARTSLDDQVRLDCYKELAEINKENNWYIMLMCGSNAIVVSNEIQDFAPNSYAIYRVYNWHF